MGRRFSIFLVVLLAIPIAALGLGYLYRVPLAQSLAETVLAEFGVPLPELKVQAVDWTSTRLTDVGAGHDQELAVGQIVVTYEPGALLSGQVEQVAIEGLRLRLDGTGERPILGSLAEVVDSLIAGPDGETAPGGQSPAIPEILFTDAQVDILTTAGAARLVFEGTVEATPEGAVQAKLPFTLSGLGATVTGRLESIADPSSSARGSARGRLVLDQGELAPSDGELAASGLAGDIAFDWQGERMERLDGQISFSSLRFGAHSFDRTLLDFDLSPPNPMLDLQIGLPEGHLALVLKGELAEDLSLPSLTAQLNLQLAKTSSLWQLSELESAPRGEIDLQVDLEGSFPTLSNIAISFESFMATLQNRGVTGQLALSAREFALPDWSDDVEATLMGDLTLAGESASLTLSAPAKLSIPALAAERLRALGLDPAWIDGGLVLSLAEASTFTLTETGLAGDLAGAVTLGKDRSLAFEGQVSGTLESIDLKAMEIVAQSGPLAGTPLDRLRLAGTLEGVVRPGQWGDGPDGLTLPRHNLALRLTELSAALGARDGLPEALSVTLPDLALDSRLAADTPFAARLELAQGAIALPGRSLDLSGLALIAELGPEGLAKPLALAGQVSDQRPEPLFHPLGFKAEVAQKGPRYDLTGEVYLPKGAGPLKVAGDFDPAKRRGRVALDVESLTFIKSLVQPKDLSPLLDRLSEVSGTVSLEADITLDGDQRQGTARLGLSNMGFTLDKVAFEGLNLALLLDRLEPPGSAPGQTLSAQSIDPGVPIKDLSARFQVLPGEPAKLRIEEATFRAAGGRFRLADTLLDPSAETNRVVLEVIGLDLADLLKDYPIEGLTVTGLLTGAVPVTLAGGELAIDDATLEAQGPGLLQFRSQSAQQALASGGDPVELMLQALEDFQYETLSITVLKDVEHNTQMRIEILGNNPNVLDGYPFKFNINLSGNMGPIIAALTRGYEISNDLIRRSWKLSP